MIKVNTSKQLHPIELFTIVRVTSLIDSTIDRDGWRLNKRPPVAGDTGTVLDILKAAGLPDRYVVEESDLETGDTIWLSEFLIEELEPV